MLNVFINLLKTSKTQLGGFLTLIFITAIINNPSMQAFFVFVLSIISTVFFDILFLRLRKIKLLFPSAALVTGCIIGLLTSPLAGWHVPVAIAALAMFSKNFMRFSNRHVFNPGAFGLLTGTLIFSTAVSWWAVSWQQFFPQSGISLRETIPFLILLSPTIVSMVKMKRYRITLSFLITYALLTQFLNLNSSILNLIPDPTTLFFAIVMLPEPLTSPNNHKRQIIFGAFVGFLALTISLWNFMTIDPFIAALLTGNAVFFKLR